MRSGLPDTDGLPGTRRGTEAVGSSVRTADNGLNEPRFAVDKIEIPEEGFDPHRCHVTLQTG